MRVEDRLAQEMAVHGRALRALNEARIPYTVGGAFALRVYTGIHRDTKDLDVFLMQKDVGRALDACTRAGFRTELTDPLWLGKAIDGEFFVDFIFSSGNGIAVVDEEWIALGRRAVVQGVPTVVAPPEEMIWSKSFVQERHRYDGADVAHLILACGKDLDWERLYRRMRDHWQVLFAHLLLFRFSYPRERDRVPHWLVEELARRTIRAEREPLTEEQVRLCRGTLLSRYSYIIDVEEWGYADGRGAARPTEGREAGPAPG